MKEEIKLLIEKYQKEVESLDSYTYQSHDTDMYIDGRRNSLEDIIYDLKKLIEEK